MIDTSPGRYLSPTGVFFTVALAWFKEQAVDFVVLEGGRGVQWDEIGQIQAKVGVITTLLPEHVFELGGNFEAVIQDKLSLANHCDTLIISEQVFNQANTHGFNLELIPAALIVTKKSHSRISRQATLVESASPAWIKSAELIAKCVCKEISPQVQYRSFSSPSFLKHKLGNAEIF